MPPIVQEPDDLHHGQTTYREAPLHYIVTRSVPVLPILMGDFTRRSSASLYSRRSTAASTCTARQYSLNDRCSFGVWSSAASPGP